MTRRPGELPEPEEALLGIERLTPEQEEAQAKEFDEKRDLRRRFLVTQMQNPMFREWLMEKLVGFGTFENAFGASVTGFPDPLATYMRSGMKAAGWSLWEEFDDAAPDLASEMRREASQQKITI